MIDRYSRNNWSLTLRRKLI